jgi:hypothetical protein
LNPVPRPLPQAEPWKQMGLRKALVMCCLQLELATGQSLEVGRMRSLAAIAGKRLRDRAGPRSR